MTYCTLTVSGVRPEDSANAFIDSYQKTSQVSYYKKYSSTINQYFRSKINENIKSSNIDVDGLSDSFSLDIKHNGIEFSTTMPNVANAYEYGTNNIYPQRFIEKSVVDVSHYMSNIIIDEAITLYDANVKFATAVRQYRK